MINSIYKIITNDVESFLGYRILFFQLDYTELEEMYTIKFIDRDNNKYTYTCKGMANVLALLKSKGFNNYRDFL